MSDPKPATMLVKDEVVAMLRARQEGDSFNFDGAATDVLELIQKAWGEGYREAEYDRNMSQ